MIIIKNQQQKLPFSALTFFASLFKTLSDLLFNFLFGSFLLNEQRCDHMKHSFIMRPLYVQYQTLITNFQMQSCMHMRQCINMGYISETKISTPKKKTALGAKELFQNSGRSQIQRKLDH